jgi:hypothetical protein
VEQLQKETSSSHLLGEKLEEKISNSLQPASNPNCADNPKKIFQLPCVFVYVSIDYIRDCGLSRSGLAIAHSRKLSATLGGSTSTRP